MNPSVLILLFVTLVWGTTFPLLKLASADLGSVEISAVRFCIAAVCLLPFVLRASRRVWIDGAILGALALLSYITQAYGLTFISSNRSAFLTSLNVLMVPLLGVLFGVRLSLIVLISAVVACAGIGLMSLEGGSHRLGDTVTMICALAYALYVILLSQRSKRHTARELAGTQIICMALIALVWMLLTDWGGTRLSSLPSRAQLHWGTLLYLGMIASAGMLFLQALAQRTLSADKSAVIYALEPVFASLFGWLLLNETMTLRTAFGGMLVIAAVIASEINPTYFKAKQNA